MPKVKDTDFWSLFEKFSGERFEHLPILVVSILKISGYDNASSLVELNDEKIQGIEQYITDSQLDWVKDDLKYPGTADTFRFLPGHKTFLCVLPSKIKSFQKSYSKLRVETAIGDENSNPNLGTHDSSYNTHQDEIDFATTDDLDELKQKLHMKLIKCSKSINSLLVFAIDHIDSIDLYISKVAKHGKPSYKTNVKCPLCDLTVPCTYVTYWQTGNLEKHLKNKHKAENSSNISSKSTNEESANSIEPSNSGDAHGTITVNQSTQRELNNILGLEEDFNKSASFED